jgi:hypothetical protein
MTIRNTFSLWIIALTLLVFISQIQAATSPKSVKSKPSKSTKYPTKATEPEVEEEAKSPWEISGKAGVVETGDRYGIKVGIIAEYTINPKTIWRTDIDLFGPDINNLKELDISIPTHLLYFPFGSKEGLQKVDPYFGPGISYTFHHDQTQSWGANLLTGVKFRVVKDKYFGLEGKYVYSNFPYSLDGIWEFALTGNWDFEF